ncbi:MAG: response regulator [Deltaproteobacteria bacterium]|nr:response regulator [Deltaproteobacteria bacterium]
MKRPLHLLLVEDSLIDAELVVRELRRGGFEVTYERVEDADGMARALGSTTWDIVISDYSLPTFSAPEALAVVQALRLDIPFIIVSGTIGEEAAVDAIKSGAHDFMTKGRFARLVPAVERELREAENRRDRIRIQEQLVISERMACVGTLVAGVAHEINNPLLTLISNLNFLERSLNRVGAELRRDAVLASLEAMVDETKVPLRDAFEAAHQVRQIVKDLKVFSRPEEDRCDPVDVHRALESSFRMAENEVRHRAVLKKEYGDVPMAMVNEARLGQVFLNLIVNAAQAIPEGERQNNQITAVTFVDTVGRVVVEIRDTGTGIPEHILPRIFDPFFTTKPVGVGTGLGLGICHRIVTSFGGRLEVESKVGEGTVFRTVLPAAGATRPEEKRAPVAAGKALGGRRILIVDDERMLGEAIRRVLPSHEVTVETSARAALLRLEEQSFDVVLCDLMMPEMTGMDLYEALSKARPETARRMIFMTGGAFTTRARAFLDTIPNYRIEKPFNPSELETLIQAAVAPTL